MKISIKTTLWNNIEKIQTLILTLMFFPILILTIDQFMGLINAIAIMILFILFDILIIVSLHKYKKEQGDAENGK